MLVLLVFDDHALLFAFLSLHQQPADLIHDFPLLFAALYYLSFVFYCLY